MQRVLAKKKQKHCFFRYKAQTSSISLPTNQKIFRCYKAHAACFPTKNQMAAFCDIKLEACNLAATKPKHVFGKMKRQKALFV